MGEPRKARVVEVEPSGLTWRKSTASGSGGEGCVEVARGPVSMLVRSSRDVHGPRLSISFYAWTALLATSRIGGLAR